MKQHSAPGGYCSVGEIIRLLRKDLMVEFRERRAVFIVLSFAIVTTLSSGIASAGTILGSQERALLLWIIMFFSAMIGLAHSFTREEERGTSLFLQLTSTPSAVFFSKLIFNILFFALLESVIASAFVFFHEGRVSSPVMFILIVLFGGLALSSAATSLSAIAAKSAMRGALFAVISFPVLLPVLIAAIRATADCFERQDIVLSSEIIFFLAFSTALVSISYLIFPYIWHNE